MFRNFKSDLAVRSICHHKDPRIEAHIFVAFLAYYLDVTLKQRLRALGPGLTSRAVIEKMSAIQMIDVHLPTTDGRLLILSRYTQPELDHRLLLQRLHLTLPAQPPPKISQHGEMVQISRADHAHTGFSGHEEKADISTLVTALGVPPQYRLYTLHPISLVRRQATA